MLLLEFQVRACNYDRIRSLLHAADADFTVKNPGRVEENVWVHVTVLHIGSS